MVLWAWAVTGSLTNVLCCSMPQLSFLGAVTPHWLWPFYFSINQDVLQKFHSKPLNMQTQWHAIFIQANCSFRPYWIPLAAESLIFNLSSPTFPHLYMNWLVQQAVTTSLLNNSVHLPLCIFQVLFKKSNKLKDSTYHLCYCCIAVHNHNWDCGSTVSGTAKV